MSKVQRVLRALLARPRELVFHYSLRLLVLKVVAMCVCNCFGIESSWFSQGFDT